MIETLFYRYVRTVEESLCRKLLFSKLRKKTKQRNTTQQQRRIRNVGRECVFYSLLVVHTP